MLGNASTTGHRDHLCMTPSLIAKVHRKSVLEKIHAIITTKTMWQLHTFCDLFDFF